MGFGRTPRRLGGRAGAGILGGALGLAAAAQAAETAPGLHAHNAVGFAVLIGLTIFATILSLLYLRERARWARREHTLNAELAELRGAHDRADLLLGSEPQIVVTWDSRGEPLVEGDVGITADGARPGSVRRVLAFGSWLVPADAAALDAAVENLRGRGERFRRTVHTLHGRTVEAQGQAVGGQALLRLRELTGERRELVELRANLEETRHGLDALSGLLDTIPQPVWRRSRDGRLTWANAAYAAAAEAGDAARAVREGAELLERTAREEAERRRSRGGAGSLRVSAVVAGARRTLDVTEVATEAGTVGIAVDVSELESVRADLQRQMDANVRTLDQLPTAVAMFDARQRLIFHNAAYRQLWDLDPAFLEGRPLDGEILDTLRNARKLPEQADFRSWKAGVLAAYRAAEAQETWWHLPDGRTLRVLADPNPQGGLTYLFEDVSERVHLESRYNVLMQVQSETLDTLREPVAVFGTDGRLKFANRAFTQIWRIGPEMVEVQPHIDQVIAVCRTLSPAEEPWAQIREAVTGLVDARRGLACRLALADGTMLDCAAEPLPDGATLLTHIDVTASVNVERALTDKNDALERTTRLRDEFVHHVSYELRSPLTNIIGFTELLGDETVGALNPRQREYADHIMRSSAALLVIINDILDLASIDAGSMELTRERVDVQTTIAAAVRGIGDRLAEADIALVLDVPPDIGTFVADGKRVRQILFNLLSNAVGFSAPGQQVRVCARKDGESLVLEVIDQGRGMPPEVMARVFERFESNTLGTRHRGVGLGLSIVRSFVELHGGRIDIASSPGSGTRVTCTFPVGDGEAHLAAAE
ncbi:sensor histidine kinase [Methylobacterium aquaticum]|uniref:sensor histidine kinase n=1 Tax=Methylobacterium aquaticum TaxID=270351 RepID=UPI0019345184|nr:PAS domain-containing sensor histidine kinase [Methylobacterium aquaticum]QRE75847.1 PAS domain-containing protein [Methylobacterium aquaticum]